MADIKKIVLVLVCLCFLPSYGRAELELTKIEFSALPGWDSVSDQDQAIEALENSCRRIEKMDDTDYLHSSMVGGQAGIWKAMCKKAYLVRGGYAAKRFFEKNFIAYEVNDRAKFTGYYIPSLKGSWKQSETYRYPVYELPNKSQLSLSRQDIDEGKLGKYAKVLVWVDDSVALFFLHIQGSGLIEMENGSTMKVGFAGKNTLPYASIGKYMIQQGWIEKEDISAFSIKEWLYAHPDQMQQVLWHNPSYIFFRKLTGGTVIGAEGVPLTGGYSLAIDKEVLPYGVPVWINTTLTAYEKQGTDVSLFRRLVVAQDTGSAITGEGRGDIFFGSGKTAETLASYQDSLGEMYILLPKEN